MSDERSEGAEPDGVEFADEDDWFAYKFPDETVTETGGVKEIDGVKYVVHERRIGGPHVYTLIRTVRRMEES